MNLAASLEQLPADVIQLACDGDRQALDRLATAIQRPFYNLAVRMLGDRTLAEDATQESLLRVITHLSQYRSEAKFATWATRVAVNAILNFKSQNVRAARYQFDAFAEQLSVGLDPAAVEKPEDALVLKQAKTLCNRALLQCLDGDHRVAFVLGEVLEFEADDAADILGIQPAAYRKRLSRARAELTRALERDCSVHTAGRGCACHRRLAHVLRIGALDPAEMEVRVGDLADMRARLTVLDAETRTRALYQGDEMPDLRYQVLESVRATLFQIARSREAP
jgi:RNA polymerase sigma factor (sigma-70 family)